MRTKNMNLIFFYLNSKDEQIYFLTNYFKLPYCSTCHSSQCDTINEAITIFDCNSPYVDKNYINTALPRVTNLNNNTIFNHSNHAIKMLNYCKLLQYFKIKKMVTNIKIEYPNELIMKKSTLLIINCGHNTKLNKCCTYCHMSFELKLTKDNKIHSNITVDRKKRNSGTFYKQLRFKLHILQLCKKINKMRSKSYG